jgi:hypothetical protein
MLTWGNAMECPVQQLPPQYMCKGMIQGIPTCAWLAACLAAGLPCCFGACRCCRKTRSSTYCTGHSTELPLPLLPLLLPLLLAPSLCRCEAYCRSCLQSGE